MTWQNPTGQWLLSSLSSFCRYPPIFIRGPVSSEKLNHGEDVGLATVPRNQVTEERNGGLHVRGSGAEEDRHNSQCVCVFSLSRIRAARDLQTENCGRNRRCLNRQFSSLKNPVIFFAQFLNSNFGGVFFVACFLFAFLSRLDVCFFGNVAVFWYHSQSINENLFCLRKVFAWLVGVDCSTRYLSFCFAFLPFSFLSF